MTDKIGSRRFTSQDQADFADLSGDYNPIHMDPVAARRTQAGAPVVHGVNVLLWCLERLAATAPTLPPLAHIKAKFTGFVYLNDEVEAYLRQLTSSAGRLEVRIGDTVVCRINLRFDSPTPPSAFLTPVNSTPDVNEAERRLLRLPTGEGARRPFPNLLGWIGLGCVRLLLCATQLVGMVCPGLHSIFAGLDLSLRLASALQEDMVWEVISRDERYRHVKIRIEGAGVSGEIESFARLPPVDQLSMDDVATFSKAADFSTANVLVVGGSRGLGEVVAKLAASTGAKVTITYASGRTDAEHVASQIHQWGGRCDTLRYRADIDPDSQLSQSEACFTHIYHFASPLISRRKLPLFDFQRFSEFCSIYNEAFVALCKTAVRLRPAGVVAFYPSTVFIDEKPAGFAEYYMAKAMGEMLSEELQRQLPSLRVIARRLPRMLTDQTAQLGATNSEPPLPIMADILHMVQSV